MLYFSAADWKLDEPDWTGRLRVVSKGNDLVLKLEDANTGKKSSSTCPTVCNNTFELRIYKFGGV